MLPHPLKKKQEENIMMVYVVIKGDFPSFIYFKSSTTFHPGPRKIIYEDYLKTFNLV